MKTLPLKTLILLGSAALCAQSSFGALFSTDFNTDQTANWTVNDPGLSDILADFYYDYSAIGVPAAPNGTGTRGLKMTANNTGGVFSGFSVSPLGQSFSGNYRLSFDIWQNYAGPVGPGGNGTTQLSLYGIGTSGASPAWIGNSGWTSGANGVGFGTTLDGGSASDFRAYSSAAPTSYPAGNAVYQAPAGVINESAPYYAFFAPQSAPAAQVALFSGQTGSTDPGETSFAWRRVVIEVFDGFASWSIDGLPLARIDLSTVTLGGGNIFFGHNDTNAGSSTDPNDFLLNVTLIDNVVVMTATPPPDFDFDGDVDGADFVAWQTNFPKASGATRAQGDADFDGDVDGADFVIWQTFFPSFFPFPPDMGASPVPEPAAIILALLGGAIALARRRRAYGRGSEGGVDIVDVSLRETGEIKHCQVK